MKRLISALLLLASAALADDRVTQKFALPENVAADMIPSIEAMAGETGSVAWDRKSGTIVVYAGPEAQATIAELVANLQVQPRNIKLDVTTKESSAETVSEFGADVSAHVAASPTKTGYRVKVTPHAVEQATRKNETTSQTLVVSDGHEAVLRIGHEIPHEEWLMSQAGEWGYIPANTRFRNIGAALRVKASIMSDERTVMLHITPELTGISGTDTKRISFVKAETDLKVTNGSTVSLGGLAADDEFYRRFLASPSVAGHLRRLDITVRVEIIPVGR